MIGFGVQHKHMQMRFGYKPLMIGYMMVNQNGGMEGMEGDMGNRWEIGGMSGQGWNIGWI